MGGVHDIQGVEDAHRVDRPGVPPHIVRQIVGHSDIGVTTKVYAHASLDEQRKALRKLGDALS
ncbi:hypothetical protein ABZ626_30170 [Streptomyces longispororuber]|uniref:hypothetical protein n=1 Tax=Streptomyces longispororuber TaxID=68230 RepID=UPI0033F01F6B